jgi:pyrimidine-nucleoside phosphorylase
MSIPEIIEKKRDGRENTTEEFAALVNGLLDGSVPDYQLSAWLMAVLFRGMTRAETASFTRLMMESGRVLDLSDLPGIKVDKHSTGGVGDKITLPLAPAAAAAGVTVPMISGRGLGHTGGTLDKLETIPGLQTDLDPEDFRRVVRDVGFAIIGAGRDLAPADQRLYALRDVTGTVPSIPLITASILSKKYAAGVDALVLDVKTGSGAFMRDWYGAKELARTLVAVSEAMGKRATAFVTSMDQPLGHAVGNALEVKEAIAVLRGEGPEDVTTLVGLLGAEMVRMAGVAESRVAARRLVEEAIATGEALETFRRWVAAQGGDPRALDRADGLPQAPVVRDVPCPGSGYLAEIDTKEVGLAANRLGAGRARLGDPVDPAVGFVFRARLGDPLQKGQPIAEVHARNVEDAARASRRLEGALRLAVHPPQVRPLVLEGGSPGT